MRNTSAILMVIGYVLLVLVGAVQPARAAACRGVADAGYGDKLSVADAAGEVVEGARFHDEESGLVYNRRRMLNPTLGRFMQRDPLGYVDGMSLYVYVTDNPLIHRDPDGRKSTDNRFGLPDKFWDWAHKNGLLPGNGQQIDRNEAEQLRKQWEAEGRPSGDNKGSHRGGRRGGFASTKLLGTVLLCGCELTCALRYNACVQKADKELEDDLDLIDQKQRMGQFNDSQGFDIDRVYSEIDEAVNRHTIAAAICSTQYTVCGLVCVLPF